VIKYRTHPRSRHRGFMMPAVLLFLALAFGAWVITFRSSATMIRLEEARVLRDFRTTWTAPATAAALRLLQTGNPPLDNYQCKLTLTQDEQTKYFLLTYEMLVGNRWTLKCEPCDSDAPYPAAPDSF